MCICIHEYEKSMRNGSLPLFAKYLRECGSVVWVVAIISKVQEVHAKLYLVVILTLGLYKLGVTCVGVEQRTHMEVSSQILGQLLV